jgi:hypothetical protein
VDESIISTLANNRAKLTHYIGSTSTDLYQDMLSFIVTEVRELCAEKDQRLAEELSQLLFSLSEISKYFLIYFLPQMMPNQRGIRGPQSTQIIINYLRLIILINTNYSLWVRLANQGIALEEW